MIALKLIFGFLLLVVFNSTQEDPFLKSKFIVEGSANTHNWTLISEVADVKAIAFIENEQLFIHKLNGVVPIFSLESENPLITIDAHEALMADTFPTIQFNLVKVIKVNPYSGDVLGLVNLEIAGVHQLLNFVVSTKVLDDEYVQINGWKAVRMSDFNVNAPNILDGTIQAYDDIVIRFEMTIPLSSPKSIRTSS